MSKKETRRAAREAFPKAKTPPAPRGKAGTRPRGSGASRNRGTASRLVPKPPGLRRSVTWGAIMAVLYFVLIEWIWKSGTSPMVNAITALVSFVIFAGIVYATDRFKYQRYLRKQKGSSK